MDLVKVPWGKAHSFEVTLRDEDGNRINLAGKPLLWMAKRYSTAPDAQAFMSKTTGSGILLINAPSGIARVNIYSGDTTGSANAYAAYWWQMDMYEGGNPYMVISGWLRVDPVIIWALP